jgi:hypothetical protein
LGSQSDSNKTRSALEPTRELKPGMSFIFEITAFLMARWDCGAPFVDTLF